MKLFKRKEKLNTAAKMTMISFDEPELVIADLSYYQSISYNDEQNCWTPPVDRLALSQLPLLNSQHGGIVYARRNMILTDFISGGMSYLEMAESLLDFINFGDNAIYKLRNWRGECVGLKPLLSVYTRITKSSDGVAIGGFKTFNQNGSTDYALEDIIFIRQPDTTQRIYGVPDFMGGINSAMLNSEATMFRRRYYHNGAHLGYIFYANDPNLTTEVEKEIKEKIEASKGVGNFKSMFINIPKGNPDGIKLIPVGNVDTKDDFANIKNISTNDLLNAHRFPAGLAGIYPNNGGNMGDIDKLRNAYKQDECKVIKKLYTEAINKDPDVIKSPYRDKLLINFANMDDE